MGKGFFNFSVFVFLSASAFGYFPHELNSGSEIMMNSAYVNTVSAGSFGLEEIGREGVKSNFGYLLVSRYAYQLFLNSDTPRPAQITGSDGNKKLIPSPDRSMVLRWTASFSGTPVTYRILLGYDPGDLNIYQKTAQLFLRLENLDYFRDYFWRIETVDIFGRSALGPIYSFSIAPSDVKFQCAPNPFPAGIQTTNFFFNMPGAGTAKFSVYSLPHLDLVFSRTLESLSDGNNLFEFDGRDGGGKVLFNGVYMAVMEMKGERGQANERFKFLVVK